MKELLNLVLKIQYRFFHPLNLAKMDVPFLVIIGVIVLAITLALVDMYIRTNNVCEPVDEEKKFNVKVTGNDFGSMHFDIEKPTYDATA